MAFTTIQKDQIRTYMGGHILFNQISSNLYLENSIIAIENLSDSSATENAVKATLVKLTALEAQMDANSTLMLATEVMQEVKFDAIRNDLGLRKLGRALINQLAIRLAVSPMVDYFGPAKLSNDM